MSLSIVNIVFIHFFTDERPTVITGCEHCPYGIPCDPTTGACIKGKSYKYDFLLVLSILQNFGQRVAVLFTNLPTHYIILLLKFVKVRTPHGVDWTEAHWR